MLGADGTNADNPVAVGGGTAEAGYNQYRALYDFTSDNQDDLQFKVGDIIMVSPD